MEPSARQRQHLLTTILKFIACLFIHDYYEYDFLQAQKNWEELIVYETHMYNEDESGLVCIFADGEK